MQTLAKKAASSALGPKTSAGPDGISIAPPAYGIESVDRALPKGRRDGVGQPATGAGVQLKATGRALGGDSGFQPLNHPISYEAWHVVQQKQGRARLGIRQDEAHERPSRQPNLPSNLLIQRRVTWTETTVKDKDLVDTIMPPNKDFGFTAILVNGQDNTAVNPLALNEPMLFWNRARDGQVEVNVAEEAENDLGTRMELPTDHPWERLVDKDAVGNRLYGDAKEMGLSDEIMEYIGAVGQTRFRVKGDPSDGALARLTRNHEMKHVADDKAAKEAIVDPWDARIARKMRTNAVTVGPTPTAALQQFYTEIGGSGADIGAAYMAECVQRGNNFHGTEPGGKPTLTRIETTPDQSSIAASWKHPVNEGLLQRLFGQ